MHQVYSLSVLATGPYYFLVVPVASHSLPACTQQADTDVNGPERSAMYPGGGGDIALRYFRQENVSRIASLLPIATPLQAY